MPSFNFKSLSQIAYSLDNLSSVYSTVDIDNSVKTFVKAVHKGEKNDNEIKEYIKSNISCLFPSGMLLICLSIIIK